MLKKKVNKIKSSEIKLYTPYPPFLHHSLENVRPMLSNLKNNNSHTEPISLNKDHYISIRWLLWQGKAHEIPVCVGVRKKKGLWNRNFSKHLSPCFVKRSQKTGPRQALYLRMFFLVNRWRTAGSWRLDSSFLASPSRCDIHSNNFLEAVLEEKLKSWRLLEGRLLLR